MKSKPYTRKSIILLLVIPSFLFIAMSLVYVFYFNDPERLRSSSYKGDDVTEVFYYAQKVFRGEIPEKETKGTPWSQYNQADLINKNNANVNADFYAEKVYSWDKGIIIELRYWAQISLPKNKIYISKGSYQDPCSAKWTIEYNGENDWKLVNIEDDSWGERK